MRRRGARFAAVGAVASASWVTPAAAQDGKPVYVEGWSVTPPVARERWYGWQILAVAGASHWLLWGPSRIFDTSWSHAPVFPVVGFGGLVFGGAAVHFAHGQGDLGMASFFLAITAPAVGGGLATLTCYAACSQPDGYSRFESAFPVGMLIGNLGAIAVDAALIAYEPVSPEPVGPERRDGFRWSPRLSVGRDGTPSLGLQGTF